MLRSLLLFSAILLFAGQTMAADEKPKLLGKFNSWSAFSVKEGEDQVCYMSLTSQPVTPPKQPQKAKRGKIVLMVTHRPTENSLDVVSYTAGMKLKPATDLNITIGPKKFSLFTQSDTAWSRDPATDHTLTTAIRNGATLMASGTTSQGTTFQDALALKGSSAAYAAMSKACGVNVPEPPKPEKKAESPKKPATPKKPAVKK